MAVGSIALAQASGVAAATGPMRGTIFNPAEVTRHGAATRPQPVRAQSAPKATRRMTIPISLFYRIKGEWGIMVDRLAPARQPFPPYIARRRSRLAAGQRSFAS